MYGFIFDVSMSEVSIKLKSNDSMIKLPLTLEYGWLYLVALRGRNNLPLGQYW